MKIIYVILILFSAKTFACGPWGCYSNSCLSYGALSTELIDLDLCAQEQVAHLDPNNRTESNFKMFAWELLGAKKDNDYNQSNDQGESERPPTGSAVLSDGVIAFRAEKYKEAIEYFKSAPDDIALYYLGRAHLRFAQVNYDGYMYRGSNIDVAQAKLAREAFLKFAKKFPTHEWAKSSVGLARRSAWLADQMDDVYLEWGRAVDLELADRNSERLYQLFEEGAQLPLDDLMKRTKLHPILWIIRAYYATRKFREADNYAFDLEKELKALASDKASFKKYGDLYAWANAVYMLKLGRAKEGYELLQNQPVAKTNGGSLSWVILNARLLIEMGRFTDARQILEKFIIAHPRAKEDSASRPRNDPDSATEVFTYQIGPNPVTYPGPFDVANDARNFYGMTYIWEKKPRDIVSEKNLALIGDTALVRFFIQGTSPTEFIEAMSMKLPTELRKKIEPLIVSKLIAMKEWALAWKAMGLLETQPAKSLLRDVGTAAKILAIDPSDAESNARVGIFLAKINPGPEIFAPCENQNFSPMVKPSELFIKSLNQFKADEAAKKRKKPIEAKLLSTMLHCFKVTREGPICGNHWRNYESDQSPPLSERRSWFKRLHKRFPNSPEAKAQTVYW